MASASFRVNGAAVTGAVTVTYGSTVTLSLVSTADVRSVSWAFTGRSDPDTFPAITPSGSPSGATATFPFRAAPADTRGRGLRVTCVVVSANGQRSEMSAVIGVPGVRGVVPLCSGETTERSAEFGWGRDVYAALEANGAVAGGLGGHIDVSKAPYNAVPNDRSAAAANTVAFQAAIDAAHTSGGVVWIPPGMWWLAKGSGGADANGWTCALALRDSPVTIAGAGGRSTYLRYCASGGAYDCIIHSPETADHLTEPYRLRQNITGINFQCEDYDLGGGGCKFGIKGRKWTGSTIDKVMVQSSSVAGISLGFGFNNTISNCEITGNNGDGIIVGMWPGGGDFNGNQIRDCAFAYNSGLGILWAHGTSGLVQGCLFQNNGRGGAAIFEAASLTVDSCYFEGSCEDAGPGNVINYPSSGMHFNGGATAAYADIYVLRASVDLTDPLAWAWTLNPNSGGVFTDNGSNPGITISNCKTSSYAGHTSFIATNAAEGLRIRDCVRPNGAAMPLMSVWADYDNGFLRQFTASGCDGFSPVSCITYVTNGSTATACMSKIDGTSRRNLLPADLLAGLTTHVPVIAATQPDGEVMLAPEMLYQGRPVYKVVGAVGGCCKGISISTTDYPELAGKLVYIAARVYVPSLSGEWPTQVLGFVHDDGGAQYGVQITPRAFATGWQVRGMVAKVPTSGTLKLGFSKQADTAAYFCDPVIAELGAPFEEVAAASASAATTGWRCALDMRFDWVGSGPSFSANGATTIAGVPCTIGNYANASPVMNIAQGGNGISIAPIAATAAGPGALTLPYVRFKLADLIPGYHPGMAVRVWAENPTNNSAATWDAATVLLWDGGGFGLGSGGYFVNRGKTSGGFGLIGNWISDGSILNNVATALTLGSSNATMVLVAPDVSHHSPQLFYGASGGVTLPTSLTPATGADTTTTIVGMTSAAASVGLGAQRNGSGTSLAVKFTRLRIDYQP